MTIVWLYWRWGDSTGHDERRAAYDSVMSAKAQALHDLATCEAQNDFSTAPVRITSDDGGDILWSADSPGE